MYSGFCGGPRKYAPVMSAVFSLRPRRALLAMNVRMLLHLGQLEPSGSKCIPSIIRCPPKHSLAFPLITSFVEESLVENSMDEGKSVSPCGTCAIGIRSITSYVSVSCFHSASLAIS